MKTERPEDVCLDRPIKEIWDQVIELLTKRLPEPTLRSWIYPLQISEITAEHVVIPVRNEFTKGRIAVNSEQLEKAFHEVLGRKISLRIVIDTALDTEYSGTIASIVVSPEMKKPERARSGGYAVEAGVRAGNTNLNPAHVFDSYVVGSSNRFSHAAALSVADKPGQAYNPLFLYGDVGLGKTHLLHSIGNAILQKAPNTVIRYMSCEKFTNEVINSIREQKMVEFRRKYREIGVLLMDDIQFIEGKESTQEEFFHTFNHLRDNGKQIVLTSDRPPKALAKLAERLRSRFEWGLIADIQPPDYEMRLAILRQKAESLNPALPDEVLDYIACTFTSNIRELEGALTRAHAYCSLTGTGMTVAAVSQVLQLGNQKRERAALTVERIIDAVSTYYQVEPADIRSSKRSQDLTVPRHVAMYIAHEKMELSFPRVGQAFGGRKHTSVKYAYDKVKEELTQDVALAESIRKILRQLDA